MKNKKRWVAAAALVAVAVIYCVNSDLISDETAKDIVSFAVSILVM